MLKVGKALCLREGKQIVTLLNAKRETLCQNYWDYLEILTDGIPKISYLKSELI